MKVDNPVSHEWLIENGFKRVDTSGIWRKRWMSTRIGKTVSVVTSDTSSQAKIEEMIARVS